MMRVAFGPVTLGRAPSAPDAMSFIQDFLSLLAGCFTILLAAHHDEFALMLALGVVLAGLCWWACSRYSRLWNLRFRVTFTHHLLCAAAALATLAFTLFYAALHYTQAAAYASVTLWEAQVKADRAWADRTFADAFNQVKALGLEDFSRVKPPGEEGSMIPTNHNESILTAAFTYSESAVHHFGAAHPFLNTVLRAKAQLPTQVLDADVRNYFALEPGSSYPVGRAINLVAHEIQQGLDDQLPRLVTIYRLLAVSLFVVVQLIPFGLVGLAAYHDLKTTV